MHTRLVSHALVAGLAAFLSLSPCHAQDAVLRPGDQVEIRLGGVPAEDVAQVSAVYTVDGDGFVNLPHIGKVKAAGATQAQFQSAIESAYKSQQIYTNPSITVSVASGARFVDVGGDVRAPQRVPFTADLTLLGAITATGGFTEYADQTKVRVLRDSQVIVISVREVKKDPSKDLKLKPGDKIEVPRSFW
jgi:polysaccharide export outer membrane protein